MGNKTRRVVMSPGVYPRNNRGPKNDQKTVFDRVTVKIEGKVTAFPSL